MIRDNAQFQMAAAWLGLAALSLTGLAQDAKKGDAAPPAKSAVTEVAPGELAVGGIRFSSKTREIRVPTVVNIKQAPIEYMLVHETGKTHESVLRTAVSPSDLQVALLLLNYEPGTAGLAHPDAPKDLKPLPPLPLKTPGANRLRITVEWKEGGEVKRAPLSDWMLDVTTRKPPPDLAAWVFSGSYVGKEGFAAQVDGSFISCYLDRNAMINSPAKGNWDDVNWISNPATIPEEGTEVTLIIAPAEEPPPVEKTKP